MVVILAHARGFDLDSFMDEHYNTPICFVVLMCIFVVKAATVFVVPQLFCYAAAGLMFPPLTAVLLCIAGLTLEYSINYFAGLKLGKQAIDRLWEYFEEKGRKRFNTSFTGMLMLYLLPGASRDLLGMMAGAGGMSMPRFLLAAILGSAPRLIIMVYVGRAATDPLSLDFILPLLALAGLGLAIRCFSQKRKKRGK